jgi:hypothetical protein
MIIGVSGKTLLLLMIMTTPTFTPACLMRIWATLMRMITLRDSTGSDDSEWTKLVFYILISLYVLIINIVNKYMYHYNMFKNVGGRGGSKECFRFQFFPLCPSIEVF